jgi:tRNA pseudouridine65 synthase
MLPILYQDDYYIAIYKPAGLLVHRTKLARGVRQAAMQQLRDQIGQRVTPVHRLDRPTAGVLLFALSQEADVAMKRLFEERTVQKSYWAVVRGWLEPPTGRIDYPLRLPREHLDPSEREGYEELERLPAITDYAQMSQTELPVPIRPYETARYALVKLCPQTGRTHQLRRHMAHLAHPIIGDTKYGDTQHNLFLREEMGLGMPRLLLTAVALSFTHPFTQQPITIQTLPDADFVALLDKWGLAYEA